MPLGLTFGEGLAVVGSAPALGAWDPNRALRLTWSEGDVWQGEALLEPCQQVEFKYVVIGSGRGVRWEPGINHRLALGLQREVTCSEGWGRGR